MKADDVSIGVHDTRSRATSTHINTNEVVYGVVKLECSLSIELVLLLETKCAPRCEDRLTSCESLALKAAGGSGMSMTLSVYVIANESVLRCVVVVKTETRRQSDTKIELKYDVRGASNLGHWGRLCGV